MYGSRARIGAIVVSDDVTTEGEYWRMAPEDVTVHAARMHVIDELPPLERLARMVPHARTAARDLATLHPNVVVYACTSGSFFRGREWNGKYMEELAGVAGCRVIATADASVNALRAMGARKVGIATPYTDDVNQLLHDYFTEAGFEIVAMVGAGFSSNWDVCAMSAAHVANLTCAAAVPSADAVFFACTAVPIVTLIEQLETDLGRPVVTANQASFWAAMQACGITGPRQGYGRLLSGKAPMA